MAAPFLLALHGNLTVIGKSPDGDSMRFIPDSPELLDQLGRADRKRVTNSDGSVQLRLEGIDTPETHYGRFAQPLGLQARDWLLEQAGFGDVVFDERGIVSEATPATRPAVILSTAFDVNGRPITYLLIDDPGPPDDGRWTHVDDPMLRRTMNAASLARGLAYLTLYTSTPASHRATLRAIAAAAHDEQLGVWGADQTASFELLDHDSIGPPDGALILPKLFRRCSDYITARDKGFPGLLPEWLVGVSASGRRPEDDLLLINGQTEVKLNTVVQHLNDTIRFTAPILDTVFVEK